MPYSRILTRIMFVASLALAAVIIVFWSLSYNTTSVASFDNHALGKRVESRQRSGTVFVTWLEIRQMPGGWQPNIQVELDWIPLGFGFYTAPGEWTRAGELAVPHWALLLLAIVPALVSVTRSMGFRRGFCATGHSEGGADS